MIVLMECLSLCAGYLQKQWIEFDIVFLNVHGIAVVNGVCRNTNPKDCIDVCPLGDYIEVCILDFLAPLKVASSWRFSL